MVGSGNVKGAQMTPKLPSAAERVSSEAVLRGRSKLGVCPAKLAMGGTAIVLTIGYFTLYAHKKPEATALDVAKVATGVATVLASKGISGGVATVLASKRISGGPINLTAKIE